MKWVAFVVHRAGRRFQLIDGRSGPVAFSTCTVSNPKIHRKIPAGNAFCTRILRTLPTQMTKAFVRLPALPSPLSLLWLNHSDAHCKAKKSTYLGKILGHSAVEVHRREGRAAPSAHASVDVRHGARDG